MAVAQLYHHVAPRNELSIIAKPLIRLLKSHNEVQSIVLSNIATISAERPVSVEVGGGGGGIHYPEQHSHRCVCVCVWGVGGGGGGAVHCPEQHSHHLCRETYECGDKGRGVGRGGEEGNKA